MINSWEFVWKWWYFWGIVSHLKIIWHIGCNGKLLHKHQSLHSKKGSSVKIALQTGWQLSSSSKMDLEKRKIRKCDQSFVMVMVIYILLSKTMFIYSFWWLIKDFQVRLWNLQQMVIFINFLSRKVGIWDLGYKILISLGEPSEPDNHRSGQNKYF